MARPGLESKDLQNILQRAHIRNQELNLTGCLHYEEGLFFQWIEGPIEALLSIVAVISSDDRHDRIEVLDQGALEHRFFKNWQMRFSDRDNASLMDWFASSDHVTVLSSDYARGVLAFMMAMNR